MTLGPNGIIEDSQVGTLTRKIEADQVVSVVPLTRGNPKPPAGPNTPRVTELLRKAIKWRRQLDAGVVRSKADIARREGITRARVTQVMGLLRLDSDTREQILTMSNTIRGPEINERNLRPVIVGINQARQEEPIPSRMP